MSARTSRSAGSVALVGAGPGDPGLLTVRGHALLRGADVVIYDRLVSPALLASARSDAELISARSSRSPGAGAQTKVNALMVAKARAGKTVVRLKGGDPFVFGRGGEEAQALARAGIPFEVVPGVTSAVAAPGVAGIPLTHRDRAASVAFATVTEAPGKNAPSVDWKALARAHTIVLLMGVERLEVATRALIAAGRDPATPVAVIRNATLPDQRTVVAPLSKIVAAARRARITPPAVTVIGDVVALRQTLGGWDTRPLSGVRVAVTRTREQASELSAVLRELGADVVETPAIRVQPPRSWAPLDRAVKRTASGTFDWLVFTSANGVRAFASRLQAAGFDARALSRARVCAIGSGTSAALAQMGIVADLVPETFTTRSVGSAFPAGSGRVLLARADVAEPALEEALRAKGWSVDRVTAYRLVGQRRMDPSVRRALLGGEVRVVTFASAGTVRAFTAALKGTLPRSVRVVCIGPVTAKAAREAGLRVAAVAKPHTIPALAAAVLDAVTKPRARG